MKGFAAVFQRLVELALLLVHHGHVAASVCSAQVMVPHRCQLDAQGFAIIFQCIIILALCTTLTAMFVVVGDAKDLAAVFQRLVELALLLVHHGHVVVNVSSIRVMVPHRCQLDAHDIHKQMPIIANESDRPEVRHPPFRL